MLRSLKELDGVISDADGAIITMNVIVTITPEVTQWYCELKH